MIREEERRREELERQREWDLLEFPFGEDDKEIWIVEETIKLETNMVTSTNIITP